jgi:hypothetical protein
MGRDLSIIVDARHRFDHRIGIVVDGENLRPLAGEQNRSGAAIAPAGADAPSPADHCNFAFHASRHEPFLSAGGELVELGKSTDGSSAWCLNCLADHSCILALFPEEAQVLDLAVTSVASAGSISLSFAISRTNDR